MCSAKIIKIGHRRFRGYDQNQEINIPVLISSQIPAYHLSRVIDELVEGMDLGLLASYYPGGGSPPYHPKLMLKVWIYGYAEQVYTSRPLAKAIRERIPFMWLAGCQQPCFKTLASFRSGKLKDLVDEVFVYVLMYLIEEGYISLEDCFTDGTKLEANANRYKVVWAKNTKRYKAAVEERIRDLLAHIDELNRQEDELYGQQDLEEMGGQSEGLPGSDQLRQYGQQLNARLEQLQSQEQSKAEKAHARALAKAGRQLAKEPEKLAKYEKQEQTLDGRNSYSKTDEAATFMRMKDDLLRPGYNVQWSAENQYAINFSVHQNANDGSTYIAHMDKLGERLEALAQRAGGGKKKVDNAHTDAGYGYEENYVYLDERKIGNYLKYNSFYREQKGKLPPFDKSRFNYDSRGDYFTCPQGRKLPLIETRVKTTASGYQKKIGRYQCESCEGCPVAQECKKSTPKRNLYHSSLLEYYKGQARQNLSSPRGEALRKRRGIEVETPFGDIKYNCRYRRFILRGLEKVYTELGLLAIARNMRKVYCEKSGIWAQQYAQRRQTRA